MFATFPTKPIKSNNDQPISEPPVTPLKREHRVARVYEPNLKPDFPARPQTARLQPDRPAPVLSLPGLPPRVFTPSAKEQARKYGSRKWYGAGTWLAQFRPPWSRDEPKSARPSTPNTAHFVYQSDTPHHHHRDHRTLADFDDTLAPEESFQYRPPPIHKDLLKDGFGQSPPDYFDPPPLYSKNPPEGGLRGWATVAGAFLIQFCTIGYLFTWNVFEDHYNHVFLTDQSPVLVRFIGCYQWFLAFALSLVAGKLSDMGYFQHVVLSGSLLFSVSLFLLSLLSQEDFAKVFICQALGMGTGIGLVFVPTATVCLHYFKRRKGLTVGIVMSGGSFGGMIFPSVLRALIPSRGLGGAIRVTAYIIFGCLVIANVLMVSPPKEEKPVLPVPRLDLAKYSKEKEYIFAGAATLLTFLVIYFPVGYLELKGLRNNVDPKSAFTSVVVLSFTGILGRILFGFASDILGAWNLLIPVSGGMALTMFAMVGVQGVKSLVAESIFYGFFAGAWLSLMVTALASLAKRTSEIGTRVGLIFSIGSITFLFSPMLHNAMLTSKQTWAVPCAIFGLLLLGVTVLAFFARRFLLMNTCERKRRYVKGIMVL